MFDHVKCKHRNTFYFFIEKPESNRYYVFFFFSKNNQIPIRCDEKKFTSTSTEVISVPKNQLSFWVINYEKIVLVNKIKIRTFSINVNKFKFMHNLSFNVVKYIGSQCTCVQGRWIGFGFASVRLCVCVSLCLYLFHYVTHFICVQFCVCLPLFLFNFSAINWKRPPTRWISNCSVNKLDPLFALWYIYVSVCSSNFNQLLRVDSSWKRRGTNRIAIHLQMVKNYYKS